MRKSNVYEIGTSAPIAVVTYPDELCFAFNRNVISVETKKDIEIVISSGGKSYTDEREPVVKGVKGEVIVDVSGYLQLFFAPGDNELVNPRTIDVSVKFKNTINNLHLDFSLYTIWGCVNIGEKFNAGRTLTWFRKFPFTFSAYILANSQILTKQGESDYQKADFEVGSNSLQHLDPSDFFPEANAGEVCSLDIVSESSSVFSVEFDYTFRGDSSIVHDRFIVSDCEDGIYLRWIDRHGFYCYYLFKVGAIAEQAKDYGEEIPVDYADSFGVSRTQGRTVKRSLKVYAPLVDAETYDILSSIAGSPLVCKYEGGKWVPVRIAGATLSKSRDTLQDFEIQINMPDIITQKL